MLALVVLVAAALPSAAAPKPLTDPELVAWLRYDAAVHASAPTGPAKEMTPDEIQAYLKSQPTVDSMLQDQKQREDELARKAGLDPDRAAWIGRAVEAYEASFEADDPMYRAFVKELEKQRAHATAADRKEIDAQLAKSREEIAQAPAKVRDEFGAATLRVLEAHRAELHRHFEARSKLMGAAFGGVAPVQK